MEGVLTCKASWEGAQPSKSSCLELIRRVQQGSGKQCFQKRLGAPRNLEFLHSGGALCVVACLPRAPSTDAYSLRVRQHRIDSCNFFESLLKPDHCRLIEQASSAPNN